jgi:hypothetical protein
MFGCFREVTSCYGSRNFSVIGEHSLSPYSGKGWTLSELLGESVRKRIVRMAVSNGISANYSRKSFART